MKIQIRRGVFETNSSSTHSVSLIHKKNVPYESDYVGISDLPNWYREGFEDELDEWHEGHFLVCHFGEYGWEVESYTDVGEKLQYLLTMAMQIFEYHYKDHYPDYPADWWTLPVNFMIQFTHSDDFKRIEDAVVEYYRDKGIPLDGIYLAEEMQENYNGSGYNHYGYIDHQSHESYGSLDDYLDDWGVPSITDLLFNRSYAIHTDNDNY